MSIHHIFFGLHGVLIDSAKLRPCYTVHLGRLMAERFGGTAENWSQAYREILADWDSYYADLDFSGDESLNHVYEGLIRTTRALFRLTHTPEPGSHELVILSRSLPETVNQHCDGLYPEVKNLIEQVQTRGCLLSVLAPLLSYHTRAMLAGGGVLSYIQGIIIGAETFEQVEQDRRYYESAVRRAGAVPAECMVVDTQLSALAAAHQVGMRTVWMNRTNESVQDTRIDHVMTGDLSGIIALLP